MLMTFENINTLLLDCLASENRFLLSVRGDFSTIKDGIDSTFCAPACINRQLLKELELNVEVPVPLSDCTQTLLCFQSKDFGNYTYKELLIFAKTPSRRAGIDRTSA